ncbi:protein kinase family protein [Halalkalibacter sp. APA_J-10(15)]|uniref:serine/threonine protein kinase n=1 Tax=Halalkalibacter sp. APA_J-10(15) TaxID=2933805 RepID=UPI001FF25C6A|nr:protein kinase family protein [Halalkalibacter sp. APA_J-10(15)]MCK0473642.1 protein kinase family protein [Halalkalibacter sp. APA_J-10(15)]
MKSSYSKNQGCRLASGEKFLGKWHKNPYRVIRKLGEGANGTVYLADSKQGQVALKVGLDQMSITSEVNVLKHFSKVQSQMLGPSLFDVDDLTYENKTFPFYVMEYLKGPCLLDFMNSRGVEWLGLLMVQLLGDLERLHRSGWVFGDLKPENMIVVGPPARIRLLDVGGTTLIGRSIKEFTEFYDRGYWGLGTRKAESSYDLFAVAMIMINCVYPKRFEKQGEKPLVFLKRQIERKSILSPFKHVLLKALQGKYDSAQLMKNDMLKALSKGLEVKAPPKSSTSSQQVKRSRKKSSTYAKESKNRRPEKKQGYFVEIFLLSSFFLLLYILYLFGQMM